MMASLDRLGRFAGLLWWVLAATATATAQVGPAPPPGIGGAPATGGFGPTAGLESVAPAETTPTVLAVRIAGNRRIKESEVMRFIKVQPGQPYDSRTVRDDVRRLYGTKWFHNVRTSTQPGPGGIYLTYQLAERPTVEEILFIGNRYASDAKLLKESGLKVGDSLNVYNVHEAKRKIEEFYQKKGMPETEIEIAEGERPQDHRVVFLVHEGQVMKVWTVEFDGNDESVISDGRLLTLVKCHSRYVALVLKKKVDLKVIEQDVERLTAYYRSLGYFRARVSRELEWDKSRRWLTVRFVIDEGPRYRIRDVRIAGATKFDSADLLQRLELKPGDYFSLASLKRDQRILADVYGSEGYIFNDVDASPRFLENPGELDLVYEIQEGDRFQVGKINVHIRGETPHTKRTVALNRISLRPGDIIDIRKVRASESRLKASSIFYGQGQKVEPPRIEIRPLDGEMPSSAARRRPPPSSGGGHGGHGGHRH